MTKANAEMKFSKWTADTLGKQAEVIKIALEHQQAIDNKHMSIGPKRPTMFIQNQHVLVRYENFIVLLIKCRIELLTILVLDTQSRIL